MKLSGVVNRPVPAQPWTDGEKIPWDDPAFSRRMLKEHLSQDHNAASRRFEIVHKQVDYLERLGGGLEKDLKILDLACGPGLHSHDLARRGHSTRGIDYSPASIEWAQGQASQQSLNCEFIHEDIRTADFGAGFDLAVLLFGEMNVFSIDDLRLIVRKAHDALETGGLLLLEPHEPGVIRANFETSPAWSTNTSGLFSDRPHMLLEEGFWHDDVQMAVKRWYVVDAETGDASVYSQTVVEQTKSELAQLVEGEGFTVAPTPSGWPAGNEDTPPDFYVLVAMAN